MDSILKEYKQFQDKLNRALSDTLVLDVAEVLVSHIQVSVQENVYDAYFPTRYERRMEGSYDGTYGLKSPMSYDRYVDATGTELTIENTTTGNPHYKDEGKWDEGRIGDLIEAGVGYHWVRSEIYQGMPYPRPFMGPALKKAIEDGSVEAALIEGLKKRGF